MVTREITLNPAGVPVALKLEERGEGRIFLILHGGAGPTSMRGLAATLAETDRVLLPVHPGFDGTARPEALGSVAALADLYGALLDALDLVGVTLVGSSVGGWIAAELALRASGRISGLALINAVGIAGRIADPLGLPPPERLAMVFHDPKRFAMAPSPEQMAHMAANQQALHAYAGEPFMHDPTLAARLSAMTVPTSVIWGESDGVVDLAYGRRYAEAIPGATFHAIPEAGHLPHVEQLATVLPLIRAVSA